MTVKGGRHQLTGMVALGEFYNDMKRIESGTELRMTLQNAMLAFSKKNFIVCATGNSSVEIATHLMQFIFLSDGGFRFPVAHFPTAQCPSSVLYLQFWEGVMQLKRFGFT